MREQIKDNFKNEIKMRECLFQDYHGIYEDH